MVKEEVSGSYMEDQKDKHCSKKVPSSRKVLITGVSDGNIGMSICEELDGFGDVHAFNSLDFDITHPDQAKRLIENFSYCDTMILCHGRVNSDWIENMSSHETEKIIATNLTSHIDLVSHFARCTIDAPYKKTIIIIGSMASQAVLNGSSPYCASKAGLAHFFSCAAWELTPKGFDVFMINPGNVLDTPMTQKVIKDLSRYRGISLDAAKDYWGANSIRESLLTKSEIARTVRHLAEGNSQYLSGSPINMSGGQR
jgi:NAD(P)-dependent dehydrogenase (short-subunit alcohol dehydrogenase family)